MAAGRAGGPTKKPDPSDPRPYTSLIIIHPDNPSMQRKISFLHDTGAQINVVAPATPHKKTSKIIMVQGLNAISTAKKVKFWIHNHKKTLKAVLGGINILDIPGIKTLQLKKLIFQALPFFIAEPIRHQPTLHNTSTWRYKPIPTKRHLQKALVTLLQRLEQQGCITPIAASTHLSPGWGIAKPGKPNEVRLVVDFRKANKRCLPLTQPNAFTLPQCLYEMARFQGGKWYGTTLDLKDIFFSIPIINNSGILNMCVEGMMYRWTICPQGYRNSPALATGAMNAVITL
ncbi:uncharacterized protein LOC109286261 isoform X1 [Alligator mississippiensis]|uniref:uncharacterized protein LOC109286261 isoform X1 n=1 Tax=Alligator mississippiensis TaxID=8496 RepID=UPI002877C6B2|nr:uncharacterized protein LOC109286261 isoform X1 [Alligator mississippiensis]